MPTLIFDANDTLFFKETRPMNSVGTRPSAGRFPPPARTLAGALRHVLGEALGVDWGEYRQGKATQQAVIALIGAASDEAMGALSMRGPYLQYDGERLYPAPFSLLKQNDGAYVRLRPGTEPVRCDLGTVYLPMLAEAAVKAESLQDIWLSRDDLEAVLSGKTPKHPISAAALFSEEPRLGIALRQAARSAEDGMLYQTVHTRLQPQLNVAVDVHGLPESLPLNVGLTGHGASASLDHESTRAMTGFPHPNPLPKGEGDKVAAACTVVRLGGEGRFAATRWSNSNVKPFAPVAPQAAKGVLLALLTAARFESGACYPPGFAPSVDQRGATVWRGSIAGVELTILAAALGKSRREGGWDLAKHQSRPAQALIPAGSVFFCRVDGELSLAVARLQGQQLGFDTRLGRGEIAAGYWF